LNTQGVDISLISCYGSAIQGLPQQLLDRVSLNETSRVLGPASFEGRSLCFLDLSTGSPTGTFKDLLACLVVAHCLHHGIEEFVTQTSGNTGNALAYYASRHGIRVHIFFPADSRYKMFPEFAHLEGIRFIEVEGTEKEQKGFTARYAESLDLPWLPDFQLQMEANKLRAYYLEDWCRENQFVFDWHVQALSSGFGVLGYYRGLRELDARHRPALLGVQQPGRAPYAGQIVDLDHPMMEPTLFRSEPTPALKAEMGGICHDTRGLVMSLTESDYERLKPLALPLFKEVGLELRRSVVRPDFHEKAPLLAAIGALHQIQCGRVEVGESVLVVVTGGCGAIPDGEFRAPFWVDPKSSELTLHPRDTA
jgi:Pyridoxal-phosphate dependent enzyme